MIDNITVTIESEDEDVPEPEFITSIVQRVLKTMGSVEAQINVQVVDDETIRSLNQQYRSQDKSTNVLSFETDIPQWVESNFIGDIVLCPAVIRNEAQKYHKTSQSRWAHMLIHGTLHLLGMSHEDEDQQTKMEFTELKIMTELGFDNPYQVIT